MKDIPLFPVTAITAGPLKAHGAITICLDFLSHSMQSEAQPNPGRHYVLTPAQALTLVQQIGESLAQLENDGFSGAAHLKH